MDSLHNVGDPNIFCWLRADDLLGYSVDLVSPVSIPYKPP